MSADILKLPHNELIVGMTGSGKTHYLIQRLNAILKHNPKLLKVFIVCPTITCNRTFKEWRLDEKLCRKVQYVECHQDDVNTELREIIGKCKSSLYRGDDRNPRTLVVLDDCAHGQNVKGRTSELVELAFTARHIGVATIVLTQQLTSIVKAYRENATCLVAFHNTNKRDSNALFDEHLGHITGEQRHDIQMRLRLIKYSHLIISLVHPFSYMVVERGTPPQ